MTDRDAGYREGVEAELLRCPFCGGSRLNRFSHWTAGDNSMVEIKKVQCLMCEAESVEGLWNTRALSLPSTPDDGKAEQPVALTYTNYRGETALRVIIPKSVRFGSTEWHPEPQWLLLAFDLVKAADREFALRDFGHPFPASDCAIREAIDALKSAERWLDWCVCEHYAPDSSQEQAALAQVRKSIKDLSAHAGDAAKESGDNDAETCIACAVPFVDGDMVYPDVSGGNLHEACCGPERECYVNLDTGEPIKDDEPIPKARRWTSPPDTHAEVKNG